MMMRVRSFGGTALALATALSVGIGCDDAANVGMAVTPNPTLVQIQTLSNRADLISGGDALVEITVPSDATADGLHVTLGDRDVTSAFTAGANGRILAVITGLAEGPNKLTADIAGKHQSTLTITNHKIGGPVFSGVQVKPFICATPTGSLPTADTPATTVSGLSTLAIDDQCNIAKEVKLFYRTTATTCTNVRPDPVPPPAKAGDPPFDPCFKPYDPGSPPSDVAMTTTDAGVTMPYIVRVERGTLNRGIYDIAVLFDPKADNVAAGWNPLSPQPGWNGKVLYSFGASSGQPRLQFRSEQNWNDDLALGRGFLVAINSMTDSLYNSSRVLMTETLMMMKEKIIDSFGEVKYVMGNGCSGGSINQLTAASIFPGLLDGIQPMCTYPDAETTGIEVLDCLQLIRAYSSAKWLDLTSALSQEQINAKKAAVNGHIDPLGCRAWVTSFANIGRPGQYVRYDVNETTGVFQPPVTENQPRNNCGLPESMVYNPTTNPTGVRCTPADYAVAIWGTVKGLVKDTTRAPSTVDNVGVQYGLKALISGAITPEEFVVINENAGGVDADANFTDARTVADPEALEKAYRSGIVSDASHLADTAIIDLRGWDDSAIHHQWRSFSLRKRLDAASPGHKNYVMWRYGTGLIAPPNMIVDSFTAMDEWLLAMKSASGASVSDRIIASKPKAAVDFCYIGNDLTKKVTDAAMCDANDRLKPRSSPRQVAGGPLEENILKCQLKPLAPSDYAPAVLSDDQLDRLEKVFPKGVCDFTKSGVGQQPAESPLDFTAGPAGRSLGTAPSVKAGNGT